MTAVLPVETTPRSSKAQNPIDRTDLTVVDLLRRARRLISSYGHDGDGFGKASTGFSLEGAVYFVSGFHEGPYDLRDPESAEIDLFKRCNAVFVAIARELGFRDATAGRAYVAVIEANERLDAESAIALLDRAVAATASMSAGTALCGKAVTR